MARTGSPDSHLEECQQVSCSSERLMRSLMSYLMSLVLQMILIEDYDADCREYNGLSLSLYIYLNVHVVSHSLSYQMHTVNDIEASSGVTILQCR